MSLQDKMKFMLFDVVMAALKAFVEYCERAAQYDKTGDRYYDAKDFIKKFEGRTDFIYHGDQK